MADFLLHLRNAQGVSHSILTNPQANFQQLKQAAATAIGMDPSSFQLQLQGQLLGIGSLDSSLGQLGVSPNSVIEIVSKNPCRNPILLTLLHGSEAIQFSASKEETIQSVKRRISDIINCDPADIELLVANQPLDQDHKTVEQYYLKNDQTISIRHRIPFQNFMTNFNGKFKAVESVASSQDQFSEKQKDQLVMLKKKAFNVQKKSSCTASLRNIKQAEPSGKEKLKHSSIQPYTMHKAQIDEVQQKQNKLLQILDIKETMSFGSLEESKPEQTEIEVRNEEDTLFYRLCCQYGCRVQDVKQKIAKSERKKVQILGVDEALMVEDLSAMGDKFTLTVRLHQ